MIEVIGHIIANNMDLLFVSNNLGRSPTCSKSYRIRKMSNRLDKN